MQTIYLDISSKGVIPTIQAKQGDVGRKFVAVVFDSGVAYTIPQDALVSVWYDGESGKGNYTDIGEKPAVFFENNKITVELIEQMLSVEGDGIITILLSSFDGSQLGLWNIPYYVEVTAGFQSEKAEEYYNAFSNAVSALVPPDKSLSVPGKAADSASVGIALGEKAPAGFGLGEASSPSLSSWNVTGNYGNGFSRSNSGSPDGGWWYGLNIKYDKAITSQLAFKRVTDKSSPIVAIRHRPDYGDNTPFSEWEYANPPMVEGVEYRTTERFNGRPIYTKLIDLSKHINLGDPQIPDDGIVGEFATNVATIVDARMRVFEGVFFHINYNEYIQYALSLEESGSVLFHLSDLAPHLTEVTLTLKYTKTD